MPVRTSPVDGTNETEINGLTVAGAALGMEAVGRDAVPKRSEGRWLDALHDSPAPKGNAPWLPFEFVENSA